MKQAFFKGNKLPGTKVVCGDVVDVESYNELTGMYTILITAFQETSMSMTRRYQVPKKYLTEPR